MWRLHRVVIAHHVPSEHDIPLTGEADAERGSRIDRLIFQPAIRPVAVRIQYRRMLARRIQRTVEVAAQIVTGHGFEQHLFDGAIAVLHAPEDLRV